MKKKLVSVVGMLAIVLALGLVLVGCTSIEEDKDTTVLDIVEETPKVDPEKLISQFSDVKDDGEKAIISKERFEAFIRQLADSTIVWDDAWALMAKIDDGTLIQEVRFALRLNESKPMVLDLLDSGKTVWRWQSEAMLGDKEPGAVNVLVRKTPLNDGNPSVEIILVARDRNKKVTSEGITRSRFYGKENSPGVLPNTASVNEIIAFLEDILK